MAIVLEGEEFTAVAFPIRHVGQIGAFSLGNSNRDDDKEEEVVLAT